MSTTTTTTATTTTSSPPSTVPAVTPPPQASSTTSTTTSTTPTIRTTTSSSTTTTSSSSSTTTTNDATSNPSTPTSNGNSSRTPAPSTTSGSSSAAPTPQAPVTSVQATTAIATSNGVVITQTLSITTIIAPGTTTPANKASSRGGVNIGAIVGGAIGGVAALLILTLLVFFCLRKRRKDEFDGNFDPVHVNSGKGGLGGATLPSIDFGEEDHIMGDSGLVRGPDDDGMGGRLGSGVGGGGIIMPYAYKPTTPIGGQHYQSQELPQMQQMANIGVVAGGIGTSMYGNEKQAMRPYPNSNNLYATSPSPHSHRTSPSISSNPSYTTSAYLNPNGRSPEPYTPGGLSTTSDGSSSIGYYQPQQPQQPQAMGATRGPSVLSSSSGRRNAKEMEAMGRVVVNPDGPQESYRPQQGPQQQYGQFQAYLQNGPGPYQQQQQRYHHPSSSQSSQPLQDQPSSSARPGTAVVVHEDGGRVVSHKGAGAEGGEVLSPEIPPTYDSLPVDVRRDG